MKIEEKVRKKKRKSRTRESNIDFWFDLIELIIDILEFIFD